MLKDGSISNKRTPDLDFKVFIAMLILLIIPAAITLRTVTVSREFVSTENASPYGYTWGLLIFLLPILALSWWFRHLGENFIERKAYWLTIAYFTVVGLIFCIFFGPLFLTFKNPEAVVGLYLPGYDLQRGWIFHVPIEDIAFYFLASVFILLFYIWGDSFWFGAYQLEDYQIRAKQERRFMSPHWPSALLGLGLIAAAIIYKKFGPHPYQAGFPGYLTVLVIGFMTPTFLFFRTIKPFVNWRALSLTVYTVWLISLFWEATLGLPYQWWGYQDEQMVGIFIGAWTRFPLEESLMWTGSSWGTVMIYEVAKLFTCRRGT